MLKSETSKIFNWHTSIEHNCINVLMRGKIDWRCKWISWKIKQLETVALLLLPTVYCPKIVLLYLARV